LFYFISRRSWKVLLNFYFWSLNTQNKFNFLSDSTPSTRLERFYFSKCDVRQKKHYCTTNTFIAPNLKLSKFTFITINLVQYFMLENSWKSYIMLKYIYILYFIAKNVPFTHTKLSTKISETTFSLWFLDLCMEIYGFQILFDNIYNL